MMKTKTLRVCCAVLSLAAAVHFMPAARAADIDLPGSEAWQSYLDASPVEPEDFASDPLGALRELLPDEPWEAARRAVSGYADAMLFILLAAVLSFLVAGTPDADLLDFATAGGCGILLWEDIVGLAATVCEKVSDWREFMLGFLPVYAGVLTMGGESAAGGAAGGLLLTALCFLAELIAAWLEPLLQCYLALSMACCVSGDEGMASACSLAGGLLRRALALAGQALAVLLGLQRVFTLQLDRSTARACRLLTGTVPIVGETLADAAEAALAGVQALKGWLGLAALAVIGAEFAPLYIELELRGAVLKCCGMLCSFAGIRRGAALLECLAQAVQCMAAATALFCGIAAFGTALMMAVGGG